MAKRDEPNGAVKQTKDLLAGFDRPARTPRTPPVKRDFVDYHGGGGDSEGGGSSPDPGRAPEKGERSLPTVLVARKQDKQKRRLLAWLVLLGAMTIGVVIASLFSLASPPVTSPAPTTSASTLPPASAAAPLPVATPPSARPTASFWFDPPGPSGAPGGSSAGSAGSPGSSSPRPARSEDPRVDFIRNL